MANDAQIEAQDRRRAKADARKQARREGKLGQAFGGETAGPAAEMTWGETDPRYIQWVLVAIGNLGGAATFGRSRDRGALSVTLLLDGERTTIWIAGSEDVDNKLTEIAEKLEALA